jgi:hypothetical protein
MLLCRKNSVYKINYSILNNWKSNGDKNPYMKLKETIRILTKLTHVNSCLCKWNLYSHNHNFIIRLKLTVLIKFQHLRFTLLFLHQFFWPLSVLYLLFDSKFFISKSILLQFILPVMHVVVVAILSKSIEKLWPPIVWDVTIKAFESCQIIEDVKIKDWKLIIENQL